MSRQDSHKIANSRLLALLSKLDTSRGDYGYQRQMRIVRENSRKNMGDSLDNGPCDPAALIRRHRVRRARVKEDQGALEVPGRGVAARRMQSELPAAALTKTKDPKTHDMTECMTD